MRTFHGFNRGETLIFSDVVKNQQGKERQYQGKFLKVSATFTYLKFVNDFLNGWHRLIKIVFGHFAVEGAATHAQQFGSFGAITTCCLQGIDHQLPFILLK